MDSLVLEYSVITVSHKMNCIVINLLLICLVNYCQQQQETKECRERDRLVTSDKEDMYSLVDVLEGQTLTLRCRFCKEEADDRPKNWYKIDRLGITKAEEVKLDMNNDPNDNRISMNHKHSLIITNFSMEDSGFYFCVHFEDQTNKEKFNYLVDVVFPEKSMGVEKGNITDWSKYHNDFFGSVNNLFKTSEAAQFVYFRHMLTIKAELATQWAPWGPCQACGRAQGDGLMKKRGSCRIKLSPEGEPPPPPIRNLSAEEIYFFNAPAIACRSKRLGRVFPAISNYTRIIPDFILEERCSATCTPDAEGVNKGWKTGKTKGFKYKKRSVLQEGSHLTFICPESTLDNKVVWKKNGRALKRGDNSNPHVIVDTFNTLYLIEAIPSNNGNYTCFVDDIQMQQIVVYVYSKSKLLTSELGRYLIYLGFVLFLSSFCYCAGLAMTWQRRHLFKNFDELKRERSNPNREESESLV